MMPPQLTTGTQYTAHLGKDFFGNFSTWYRGEPVTVTPADNGTVTLQKKPPLGKTTDFNLISGVPIVEIELEYLRPIPTLTPTT